MKQDGFCVKNGHHFLHVWYEWYVFWSVLCSCCRLSVKTLNIECSLCHEYQLVCAILGVFQIPNIPYGLTGLCWVHSMPPCLWKTAAVKSTFPALIYSKLAFHLVTVDTLTKQINSQISKSLWWIFSDISVYPLKPGGLRLWEPALSAVPGLLGQ